MRPLDYIYELEKMQVIVDRRNLTGFLFEYACRKLETQQIYPKTFPKGIEKLMCGKLNEMFESYKKYYTSTQDKRVIELGRLDYSYIPGLIRAEMNGKTKGFCIKVFKK